jgi:hypothetical protein
MELAIAYAVMDAQRRDDMNREQALLGIDGDWRAFHESQDHKIAVFAGRQTGKTYNIALRSLNSQYNCEIFTPHVAEVTTLVEAITQLAEEREVPVIGAMNERRHARITLDNGRQIDIYHLRGTGHMRGRRWVGKEIFFSEFDHSDFQGIMEAMSFEIPRAIRILCAGSITRMEDNYAKRFFREADLHYFIDNEYRPPTRGHMPWEHQPSNARHFIEHLPPISSIL